MKRMIRRLALCLVCVSMACSVPLNVAPTATPEAVAVSQISNMLATVAPNATATATPFQPLNPTSTLLPTALPTETPLPTPTNTPELPTPSGQMQILLLGSDQRGDPGYRTDVIMLIILNGDTQTVSVVSFPRDLYVTIPGWMDQRINTAQAAGGFPLIADTLQYNFGVRPQYYIMTNFAGFTAIIDSLGGIEVEVGKPIRDKCDLNWNVDTYCSLEPGPFLMDGPTALWYVRSRHSSSDLDRTRRAQEVVYGIFNKLMSVDALAHLPDLYTHFEGSVETNLSLDDLMPLVPLAPTLLKEPGRIHRFTFGPGDVYNYITESGAMVLLPNYYAIRQIILEALNP